MKSVVVKRSIVIAGHKTSVSLEAAFWIALKDIAASRQQTLSDLVGAIDAERKQGNLSSAIRLFVLDYYRAPIGGNGENKHTGKVALTPQAPRQFCEWNSKSSGKWRNEGDGTRAVPDVVFDLSLRGPVGLAVVGVPVSDADP